MTWSEVIARCRSESAFKQVVLQAQRHLSAHELPSRPWLEETVDEGVTVNVTLRRKAHFFTVAQFEKLHNVKLDRASPVVEVEDVGGQKMKGVMVEAPEQPLELLIDRVQSKFLKRNVASGDSMLRPCQHSDLFSVIAADSLPAPLSSSQLETLVARCRAPDEAAEVKNETPVLPPLCEDSRASTSLSF